MAWQALKYFFNDFRVSTSDVSMSTLVLVLCTGIAMAIELHAFIPTSYLQCINYY